MSHSQKALLTRRQGSNSWKTINSFATLQRCTQKYMQSLVKKCWREHNRIPKKMKRRNGPFQKNKPKVVQYLVKLPMHLWFRFNRKNLINSFVRRDKKISKNLKPRKLLLLIRKKSGIWIDFDYLHINHANSLFKY